MKAVAYRVAGPVDRDDSLQNITLEKPAASGRDLLVKIHAVSVNPVDTKLRAGREPGPGGWGVLGYEVLNAIPLELKAVSLHWELMFTRSLFGTPDIAQQGRLLNQVAGLVDGGKIRSTVTEIAGKIDAGTLRRVHAQIESGRARGKIVLEGFQESADSAGAPP